MITKSFTYEDFNGQKRTETWNFHLDKAELMKMELSAWGGLDAMLKRLMREENPEKIVEMFEKIILTAVGEKSPDGRMFIKTEQIREDFRQTPAYSELFYELVTDDEKASAFIKGCLPSELAQKIAEREAAEKAAQGTEAPALTVVEGRPQA